MKVLELIKEFGILQSDTKEIQELSQSYFSRKAVAIVEDAIHIAVATVSGIDVLVSWNFKHIVNLKTKREVNAVNLLNGYGQLEIVEPSMLQANGESYAVFQ